MVTKINSMLMQADSTTPPEHRMEWLDQSGQSAGSMTLNPNYSGFTVTGFTQIGDTTGSSITISGIDSVVRIRPGMSISGSGVPALTTVVSTNISAGTIVISNAATLTASNVTLTFSGTAFDPVLYIGYNTHLGGVEEIAGEGQARLQIEGHFHRDSDDAALMEMFFDFSVGTSGHARPVFSIYDKVQKKTLDVEFSPGLDQALNVYFQNSIGNSGWAGSADATCFRFKEGQFDIDPPPRYKTTQNGTLNGTAVITGLSDTSEMAVGWSVFSASIPAGTTIASVDSATQVTLSASAIATTTESISFGGINTNFSIGSVTGKSSFFILSAHGDDPSTKPTAQFTTSVVGTGFSDRQCALTMSDDTALLSGRVIFFADDNSNVNTIMSTFGGTGAYSSAVISIDSTNIGAAYATLRLKAKASQTGAVIKLDGYDGSGTGVENDKFNIYSRGYIAVKPSGGTAQTPGAGSNTVTLPTTNCPGTGTSTKWFPFLDTAGALYWLPAVSDA